MSATPPIPTFKVLVVAGLGTDPMEAYTMLTALKFYQAGGNGSNGAGGFAVDLTYATCAPHPVKAVIGASPQAFTPPEGAPTSTNEAGRLLPPKEVYVFDGAMGMPMAADAVLTEAMCAADSAEWDAIIFPGGLPGATCVGQEPLVKQLLASWRANNDRRKALGRPLTLLSAICAAPAQILCRNGVLPGTVDPAVWASGMVDVVGYPMDTPPFLPLITTLNYPPIGEHSDGDSADAPPSPSKGVHRNRYRSDCSVVYHAEEAVLLAAGFAVSTEWSIETLRRLAELHKITAAPSAADSVDQTLLWSKFYQKKE